MKLIDKIKNEHNEFTRYNQLKLNNDIDIEKVYYNETKYEDEICQKTKNVTLTAIGTGVAGALLCLISLPVGAIVGGISIVTAGVSNYLIDKPYKLKPILGKFKKTQGAMSELRLNILETMEILAQLENACDETLHTDVKNTKQFLELIEEKRAIIKDCFNQIDDSFMNLRKLKKDEKTIKEISELITVYTKCKLYVDEYETKYENAIRENSKENTLNHKMLNNGIEKLREAYPLKEFSFETNRSNEERGR